MAVPDAAEFWSENRIAHFWDQVANDPVQLNMYFAKHCASELTEIVRLLASKDVKILDYGCGPGFLTKSLVSADFNTSALEFSPKSSERLNEDLKNSGPNWQGCVHADKIPTPLGAGVFGLVVSTETYEHLREEWIQSYLSELYRLISPGGTLLLTTPANENLDLATVLCPNCECRFHRWGHLRSVNEQELVSKLRNTGFSIEYCRAVDIRSMSSKRLGLLDFSLRSAMRATRTVLRYARFYVTGRRIGLNPRLLALEPGAHLVCIAVKPSSK